MTFLDIESLKATPAKPSLTTIVVVRNFVKPDRLQDVLKDYPMFPSWFPPALVLDIRGNFKALMEELDRSRSARPSRKSLAST